MSSNLLNLKIQGTSLKIKTNPKLFIPSLHGSKALGTAIRISKGESVLDVGCGTGFLAILAAKKGGIVSGTDILPDAIILSKENASMNNVRVDFRRGDLFSPFKGKKFDVIIANIPQEVLSPKIKSKWTKEKVISYSGGKTGSEMLMKTLAWAKRYMHRETRLYIVVYTMSNSRKSLRYIIKNYSARLINFYSGPVKDFVYADKEWYEKNKDILIYKVGKKYFADLFVFELMLK